MRSKLHFIFVIALFLSGCLMGKATVSIEEVYSKRGVSKVGVKKALLECGRSDLIYVGLSKQERNDKYLELEFCMEQDGFVSFDGSKVDCSRKHLKDLPICQPGAEVPKRSVERRKESRWCKEHSKNEECVD